MELLWELLNYYPYDGSSWTQRWTLSGDQGDHGAHKFKSICLHSRLQSLRFKYTAGASFTSDCALDDIVVTYTPVTYAWTTDASNGTSGWSATNTEDITVTTSATSSHVGNYTITVTDANGCQGLMLLKYTSTHLITTSSSFSTFVSCSGSAGTEQSFTISGNNLTNDITVTAPTGYEVSKTSGSSFGSSVTFTQSSGSVKLHLVYMLD